MEEPKNFYNLLSIISTLKKNSIVIILMTIPLSILTIYIGNKSLQNYKDQQELKIKEIKRQINSTENHFNNGRPLINPFVIKNILISQKVDRKLAANLSRFASYLAQEELVSSLQRVIIGLRKISFSPMSEKLKNNELAHRNWTYLARVDLLEIWKKARKTLTPIYAREYSIGPNFEKLLENPIVYQYYLRKEMGMGPASLNQLFYDYFLVNAYFFIILKKITQFLPGPRPKYNGHFNFSPIIGPFPLDLTTIMALDEDILFEKSTPVELKKDLFLFENRNVVGSEKQLHQYDRRISMLSEMQGIYNNYSQKSLLKIEVLAIVFSFSIVCLLVVAFGHGRNPPWPKKAY